MDVQCMVCRNSVLAGRVTAWTMPYVRDKETDILSEVYKDVTIEPSSDKLGDRSRL